MPRRTERSQSLLELLEQAVQLLPFPAPSRELLMELLEGSGRRLEDGAELLQLLRRAGLTGPTGCSSGDPLGGRRFPSRAESRGGTPHWGGTRSVPRLPVLR